MVPMPELNVRTVLQYSAEVEAWAMESPSGVITLMSV